MADSTLSLLGLRNCLVLRLYDFFASFVIVGIMASTLFVLIMLNRSFGSFHIIAIKASTLFVFMINNCCASFHYVGITALTLLLLCPIIVFSGLFVMLIV